MASLLTLRAIGSGESHKIKFVFSKITPIYKTTTNKRRFIIKNKNSGTSGKSGTSGNIKSTETTESTETKTAEQAEQAEIKKH